jgi:hypothetical protein
LAAVWQRRQRVGGAQRKGGGSLAVEQRWSGGGGSAAVATARRWQLGSRSVAAAERWQRTVRQRWQLGDCSAAAAWRRLGAAAVAAMAIIEQSDDQFKIGIIMGQLKILLTCSQDDGLTNAAYYDRFETRVDVAEHRHKIPIWNIMFFTLYIL